MKPTEFLNTIHPDSTWVLTAITADGEVTTESFLPSEPDRVDTWLDLNSGCNIYYSLNPTRFRKVTKKLNKEGIRGVAFLHVDIDPEKDENLNEAQERIEKLLANPPEGIVPPTIVVFSGGGYQAMWKLTEEFSLGDEPDAGLTQDIEKYNRRLEEIFKADSCHNVDRIMRLPGTVNHPNAKKVARGQKPTLAKVVKYDETAIYPLAIFSQSVKVQDSSGLEESDIEISGNIRRFASVQELPAEINDKMREVILHGEDPDDPSRWPSQSEALFWLVCRLAKIPTVTNDNIYSIITDESFKISHHCLKQANPDRAAKRTIRRARDTVVSPELSELNQRHAVIENMGSKCVIMTLLDDGQISFQNRGDFSSIYMNRFVEAGQTKDKRPITKPLGDWWLKHPSRRQYRQVVFDPKDRPGPNYNLWRGFQYASDEPKSCELFLTHLRDNLCWGEEAYYQWLLGWMAFAVQHPDTPPGSAIVLQGEEGTGKSFFAKQFGELFGQHFKQVTDTKHLTGSFNAHLRDCVLLFADEAFYAGDKSQDGRLKTIITEERMQVERKGYDVEQVRNNIHLIMASNDNWVVPAGKNSRRYFVLRVSNNQANNGNYFKKIQDQLQDGGYAALLRMLLEYDLTTWNRQVVPITPALRDQQRRSLDPLSAWWYMRLTEGALEAGIEGWPTEVEQQSLYQEFRVFSNQIGQRYIRAAEFYTDIKVFGIRDDGRKDGKTRRKVLTIPPIEEAKKLWEKTRGKGDWF
jgi:hypothetical protein